MFTIHGHLLPHCSTYEEAVKVYEAAHQHPRFTSGWRGLKDKRDTSKQVCLTGTGAVVFRYHHTDMIIWLPDRVEIKLYDSRSSGVFLDRFLPSGLTTKTISGEMYIADRNGNCFVQEKGPLVFTYDGKWVLDQETAHRFEGEVLDRKRANQIRKIAQPFLDWWESMQRLRAPITHERIFPMYDVLFSLKTSLERGVIPEDHYRQLAASWTPSRDVLVNELYVLGGAVQKQRLPPGVPRPKNKYAGARAWNLI